jgi:transposase
MMTYSYDLKARVLTHVRNGGSQVEACRLFGVNRRTILRWQQQSTLKPTKIKRTRKRKLDKALLEMHVRQFPDSILRERAEHFKVSHSAIWKSLRRLNIVKKND